MTTLKVKDKDGNILAFTIDEQDSHLDFLTRGKRYLAWKDDWEVMGVYHAQS